ncbi:MAG: ABC transporter ATP-binding protein [Pirellulaceae bacterium]|nr:ABC transporter ATP-binding protein [Pirellulaceae bacterium]
MIRVEDLQYEYGTDFRLCVPHLAIARGEKVAIVGPSGSGKTTLLMLLAGVKVPSKGSILVGQTRVDGLSDAARRKFRVASIGFVFQEFELLEYLSVRENILLPYMINPALRRTSEVEERVMSLAQTSGLKDKLARRPDQLSQGERQRVALCRAMVTQPQVILADEPTGSLDPQTTRDVLQLMFDQVDQSGATLVMVTHDHAVLGRFDRTIDLSSSTVPCE